MHRAHAVPRCRRPSPTTNQGKTLDTDAYRHLPQLRERITPPESSALRATPQLIASWDERARALGRGDDWRLSDAELDDAHRRLLDAAADLRGAGDDVHAGLWVFGYGSLTWDPGFHFCELRLARLSAFQRRFGCRTTFGRGAPDCPGLMLTLLPGEGECVGLAFRIDAAHLEHELGMVWRREMIRGTYRPCLLPLQTPQGDITALVFAANDAHADHVGELTLEQTADSIARASGVLGSNRQYLEQLVAQLGHLDIRDRYLDELLDRVRRRCT